MIFFQKNHRFITMSNSMDHEIQTTIDSLLAAATGGDLDTVINLLNADASMNIYATNANDESLIVDVIRAEKQLVAQHLFKTYETDLSAIENFFKTHRSDADTLWHSQPILVACGGDLCDAITQIVPDSMRLPRPGTEEREGLIVLLKRINNVRSEEVLWLSPSKHNNEVSITEDRSIAQIVELIYTESGGGVMDIMMQLDNNLLSLAAQHGMSELFFRMQPYFGKAFTWNDYIPMLGRLVRRNGNAMVALQGLIDRLALFQLDDLYSLEDSWHLLEIPIEIQQPNMFEDMLKEIVRIRRCQPSAVLNDLFQKSHLLSFDNICYTRKLIDSGTCIMFEHLCYSDRSEERRVGV